MLLMPEFAIKSRLQATSIYVLDQTLLKTPSHEMSVHRIFLLKKRYHLGVPNAQVWNSDGFVIQEKEFR